MEIDNFGPSRVGYFSAVSKQTNLCINFQPSRMSPCISHKKFEFEANKEKVQLEADLDQELLANQELQEKVRALQAQMTDLTPVPSWWDGIFEASDVNVSASKSRADLVKRKLLFSPVRELCPASSSSQQLLACSTNNKCMNENNSGNQVLSVSTDASDSGFKTNSPQLTNHVVQNGNVKRSEKNEDCRLQLYPSQIKIASAKLALNSGKEHFTTKGKLKKARSLKPPCKSSCKRCEVPKITESDRREISSEFWGLGDHVKQWKYINDSISSTAPRTKTSMSGAKGEKLSSRTYYLTVNGKKMKVCKTMFRSTLSICDSWVTSALSHFVNGNVSRDKRGRKPLLVKSSLA